MSCSSAWAACRGEHPPPSLISPWCSLSLSKKNCGVLSPEMLMRPCYVSRDFCPSCTCLRTTCCMKICFLTVCREETAVLQMELQQISSRAWCAESKVYTLCNIMSVCAAQDVPVRHHGRHGCGVGGAGAERRTAGLGGGARRAAQQRGAPPARCQRRLRGLHRLWRGVQQRRRRSQRQLVMRALTRGGPIARPSNEWMDRYLTA